MTLTVWELLGASTAGDGGIKTCTQEIGPAPRAKGDRRETGDQS